MFCLFIRLFSAFPFTQVFTYADFNVDRRAGQVHETYQFAERHLPGNAPMREVIRPRIGEDDALVGSRSIQVPYYFLPMFQHSAVPLVNRNVFKPVVGKIQLPTTLTNILLPQQNSPELNNFYPVRNPRGVEVWCGYNHISVRVNRGMLGFRCLASVFFLGTCPVTRVTPFLFYFHYNLNDCGSTQTTVNGQLVYSNSLYYSPLSEGSVIRAIPLSLPVQCIYNRFHYSYKVGYVPEVHEQTFLKSMKSKRSFRLSACNAEWKHLSSEESYMLGEQMYFEAYAAFVPQSQRVFVDSCFITPFKEPNTIPRFEVIHNFGCMVDSKREGSRSQFFSREENFLLFTVDAFLFPQITDKQLYLHCNITVGKSIPKRSAKSCTYNRALQRWEELYGSSSVCSCCDSVCEVSEFCK
uniref:Zona pellucida sperm-binding protein 3 n=1 Tax=Esox lucius TaxID=8010 RepID=A0A3P8Z5L3_ESOLU